MKKAIILVFGILALAALLSGCSQSSDNGGSQGAETQPQPSNGSGSGVPADTGLAALDSELGSSLDGLNSLDSELSNFNDLESIEPVNPADLQ